MLIASGSPPRLWGTLQILQHPERSTGSPPRLWGTLLDNVTAHAFSLRFTPTPVGNTPFSSVRYSPSAVHPHACGEHSIVRATSASTGSPPRLWGTHLDGGVRGRVARFTPTPVGNTWGRWRCAAALPVHPHACGEHTRGIYGEVPPTVHPHACGEHGARGEHDADRFTPTPVGNTRNLPVIGQLSAVHPHACGEHPRAFGKPVKRRGSPPRLWGTRCC